MNNLNLTQNINGAEAPGRGYSSAPWNNHDNPFNNSKKVLDAKSEQKGRSMIEMLGVLAIIGVLSVGGIAGYSKAMQKYRINKTIEQITLVVGNVQSFYASSKDYAGLDGQSGSSAHTPISADALKIISKAKLVPDEMIENNDIVTALGATMEISKDTYGDSLIIRLNSLDMESCIELSTNDWTNIGNLIAIAVGDATAYSLGRVEKGCNGGPHHGPDGFTACVGGSNPVPLTPDIAASYCFMSGIAGLPPEGEFALKIKK